MITPVPDLRRPIYLVDFTVWEKADTYRVNENAVLSSFLKMGLGTSKNGLGPLQIVTIGLKTQMVSIESLPGARGVC